MATSTSIPAAHSTTSARCQPLSITTSYTSPATEYISFSGRPYPFPTLTTSRYGKRVDPLFNCTSKPCTLAFISLRKEVFPCPVRFERPCLRREFHRRIGSMKRQVHISNTITIYLPKYSLCIPCDQYYPFVPTSTSLLPLLRSIAQSSTDPNLFIHPSYVIGGYPPHTPLPSLFFPPNSPTNHTPPPSQPKRSSHSSPPRFPLSLPTSNSQTKASHSTRYLCSLPIVLGPRGHRWPRLRLDLR